MVTYPPPPSPFSPDHIYPYRIDRMPPVRLIKTRVRLSFQTHAISWKKPPRVYTLSESVTEQAISMARLAIIRISGTEG